MDKIERLINLMAYLLDTSSPVTFDKLKGTVYSSYNAETGPEKNALHKMFERDKEELRDMGVEIETLKTGAGDEGYIIRRSRYYLPQLDLTVEERVALTMVSRLFLGSGTPFSGPAHSAFMKLVFDEDASVLDVPHVHWVEAHGDSEALSSILDGLVRRKYLRFSYRALDASEPIERTVEPYGLFNRRGYWYLVGLCHTRRENRCFKVDRIASAVQVNEKKPRTRDFEVPDGFRVRAEIPWEWPPPQGVEDIESSVVFSPRLAFARESGPGRFLSDARSPDGSLEVTYEVSDPEQFVEWVLGFGTEARITEPAELREMVAQRLTGLLKGLKP